MIRLSDFPGTPRRPVNNFRAAWRPSLLINAADASSFSLPLSLSMSSRFFFHTVSVTGARHLDTDFHFDVDASRSGAVLKSFMLLPSFFSEAEDAKLRRLGNTGSPVRAEIFYLREEEEKSGL